MGISVAPLSVRDNGCTEFDPVEEGSVVGSRRKRGQKRQECGGPEELDKGRLKCMLNQSQGRVAPRKRHYLTWQRSQVQIFSRLPKKSES